MKRVQVKDLTGPALDWATGRAVGMAVSVYGGIVWDVDHDDPGAQHWTPSTNWAQLGLLIDRHDIVVGSHSSGEDQDARRWGSAHCFLSGTSFQTWDGVKVAACRALVARHLGVETEVPEELIVK